MGKNRLIREKATKEKLPLSSVAPLELSNRAATPTPPAKNEQSLSIIAGVLLCVVTAWVGFSLRGVALASGVWSAPLLTFWLGLAVAVLLALGIFALLMKAMRPFVVGMIAVFLVGLGVLKLLPEEVERLLQVVRFVDVATPSSSVIDGLETILNTLITALGTIVVTIVLVKVVSIETSLRLSDGEKKLIGALKHGVVYERLKKPKLEIVGTPIKVPTEESQRYILVEIWLVDQRLGYAFDDRELQRVLENRADRDGTVVIVRGAKRDLVAYETVGDFLDALLAHTTDIVDGLQNHDIGKLRKHLKSHVILANKRNWDAVYLMLREGLDRVMVLAKSGRYLGFCSLNAVLGSAIENPEKDAD